MRTQFKLLTIALIFISQFSMADDQQVFKPVSELFLGMSEIDHEKMKSVVTKDFVLLEHGEVWSIGDLMNAASRSEYKRTNYFSVIGVKDQADMAWINYWNKGNFDNGKNSQDVVWLESVVVVKDMGVWKLAQMHSTRLEPTKVPKNIPFIQQRTD